MGKSNLTQLSMPLGLYATYSVSAPCGLCSADGIIGLLDMPNTFLDPGRVRASMLWFTSGYVEYRFPANASRSTAPLEAIEFSMELSSDSPGTSPDWPSEITLSVNDTEIGTWTLRADRGDGPGISIPDWWRFGSKLSELTTWRVTDEGTYLDGERISPVSLSDLDLGGAQPIRLRIGVASDAKHPGGVNIFGRGFGHHDQEIVMRLETKH